MERGSKQVYDKTRFRVERTKSNLEFDYLLVQFIYVSNWAKGIANIETGQRVGQRVNANGVGVKG